MAGTHDGAVGGREASGRSRGRAAQLLEISKETLRYHIEKHQLQAPV